MALPIKTLNANQNDAHAGGALTHQVQESVIIDLSCTLPQGDLAKLYRSIETALPETSHRIVQFVSAYAGEGASTIAFEMAVVVSQMMGKRVLFIDMGNTQLKVQSKFPDSNNMPLDTLLLTGRPPHEAIAQAAGTELYFTRLRQRGDEGFPTVSLKVMETALEYLKPLFDLIVIDSQAILKDAFGVAFAKLADGSILVVEAEHTRAPVAQESKRMVEAGGGKVIGAVLNKRRFYIPRFLYRLLYPSGL